MAWLKEETRPTFVIKSRAKLSLQTAGTISQFEPSIAIDYKLHVDLDISSLNSFMCRRWVPLGSTLISRVLVVMTGCVVVKISIVSAIAKFQTNALLAPRWTRLSTCTLQQTRWLLLATSSCSMPWRQSETRGRKARALLLSRRQFTLSVDYSATLLGHPRGYDLVYRGLFG
jgi:hypothetical protein